MSEHHCAFAHCSQLITLLEPVVRVDIEAEDGRHVDRLVTAQGWAKLPSAQGGEYFRRHLRWAGFEHAHVLQIPDASRVQATTMRTCGRPSGRSVRMGWGSMRVPPRAVPDSSAYCMTAVPEELLVSG